jgi:predicted phage terminase large subunit-like protein
MEFRKTLAGFCLLYLPHYFYLAPPEFESELLAALDDEETKRLLVLGFRGSGKSTDASVALVLHAALEKTDRYPFIVPISDTGAQAALNIAAIKYELENNWLLKNDYGHIPHKKVIEQSPEPTLESEEEWQAKNLLLDNGVRILARSRGQKVRGIRHRQYRPRLIVLDDPEDLDAVKTKENRDKSDKWLRGEVLGALDQSDGRIIIVGNLLHMDSLLARLRARGTFKNLEYPLIKEGEGSELERCTWPAQYPTQEALDLKRKDMGEVAWSREMLLKVVSEEGQEITPEDIVYYDQIPSAPQGFIGHGVDLAISKKSTADCTAVVTGDVRYIEDRPFIFVTPDVVNKRMDFHETINTLAEMPRSGGVHLFCVENVAYQAAALQEMERRMLAVRPMRPNTDKRSRLRVAATYIKNGTVRFPRTGMEELLTQLFGFGTEAHDDLVDALVYLILGLAEEGIDLPQIYTI